ncbi:hypothetical protein TWF102_002246 [Orbilia oligospora]|uniref:Uncharacterized protein n=1 Tax=Orbilia oligospora TaxID=2813651 RepID=A0A7C8NF70_ORBOL|nr:hypothetical protein TWF706_007748 [Orbilia oligospora]KAF3105316.1 hypothetical protein TWF102_002246 [Orbilia oligospora]KAF3112477.1 hypothetical protein TWF103_003240 [Orbilia oligospora]KAF3143503.1 hypothetical protein TWF594_005059 [Orbilia oligospora]
MPRRRASISNSIQISTSSHPASTPSINLLCTALKENGSTCPVAISRIDQKYCTDHRKEYQGLYESYKQLHSEYDCINLEARPRGALGGPELMIWKMRISEKIEKGEEAARQRSQVNRRFFSQGAQSQIDRNHVREILKLEFDVGVWKRNLKVWNDEEQLLQRARNAQKAIDSERARISQLLEDERHTRIAREARDYQIARDTRKKISLSLSDLPYPTLMLSLLGIGKLLLLPFLFIAIHFIYSFFNPAAGGPGEAPDPGATELPGSSSLEDLLNSPAIITIIGYATTIFWWSEVAVFVAGLLLALIFVSLKTGIDEDRTAIYDKIRYA